MKDAVSVPAQPGCGALSVTTITTTGGLLALREEWARLFERAGEGLPFNTHEWTVAWWEHLRQDTRVRRDVLSLRVLRDPRGALVAVAPCMLTERPARGPLRARTLHYIGTDPNLTELRRLLAEPAHETAALTVLLDHAARAGDAENGWDWLVLSGLRDGVPSLAERVHRGAGFWSGETPAYILALPGTWDDLRRTFKRNIRESLRKCYNSLARAHFNFELRVAEGPDEVAAALEVFFDLHRRRAALRGTVVHADYFRERPARAFLRAVCDSLARRGAAQVFLLHVGSRVVAARVGFRFGDRLYLYYSGYDPAWAPYSVMTTTVAETLKWAIAGGLRSVHLSTGRDVSKTRWSPEEIMYREVTLLRPGLRSRLAYESYRWGFQARAKEMSVLRLARRLLHRPGR